MQADALVNTTDTNLGFGGFVSKALLKAAGDTLKDECANKAPVPVGGVAVTGAGSLKCKHIMHVVLPNYDGPGGQSEKVFYYYFYKLTNLHACITGPILRCATMPR